MDEKLVFAILGIEKTKDEEAIRTAYRTLLAQTNPEDDPEGFKRLRTAYEQAVELAHKEDEETDIREDNSPAGVWMQKVSKIYGLLSHRLDENKWRELLEDEICADLEYGEQVKWRLFEFLSEHYIITSRIYQVLDEYYHIEMDADLFKEHLPVQFVDYMIGRVHDTEGNMDFDFQYLRGADDADYDSFISYYQTLWHQVDENDGEAALQTARAMEEFNIYHPYVVLERAQALLQCKQTDKALEDVRSLIAEYEDNLRIQLLGNSVIYDCGNKEEAIEAFRRYKDDKYFIAERYMAMYDGENGDYTEAIGHCLKALRIQNNDELEEYLEKMDAAFIEQFEAKQAAGVEELTTDEKRSIAGAYSRKDEPDKAIALLENHPEWSQEVRRYYSYLGILYLQIKNPDKALEALQKWKEKLQTDEEADNEELAEAFAHEADAYYIRGIDNKDNASYSKAIELYNEAIGHNPQSINYSQRILDIYIALKDYNKAIELADELIKRDAGWFPAYAQRQKANFELMNAQEVIDDFYAAKQIFAGFAPMYENAMEVFLDFGQTKDADNILAQANEAEVRSDMLDVLELRSRRISLQQRMNDMTEEEREAGISRLYSDTADVEARFESNKPDDKVLCELYKHAGILNSSIPDGTHGNKSDYKKAAEYYRKAIACVDEAYTHYLLANALFDDDDGLAAIEEYIYCENNKDFNKSENFYINMARCYRYNDSLSEAIEKFKKVIEINPDNDEANGAIVSIYRELLEDKCNIYYAELAEKYAEEQRRITPDDAWMLRELGFLYLDWGKLDKAMEDAGHSLEIANGSIYGWNLMGEIYRDMKQYEDAIRCYSEAIKNIKTERFKRPYSNMGQCYERLGKKKEAADTYLKALERYGFDYNDNSNLYDRLFNCYIDMQEYDSAMQLIKKMMASSEKSHKLDVQYAEKKYTIEKRCGNKSTRYYLKQRQKLADKEYRTPDSLLSLATFYMREMDDIDKSIATAEEAYELAVQNDAVWDNNEILLHLMYCCGVKGYTDRVKKYAEAYKAALDAEYSYNPKLPADIQFMNDIDDALENTIDIARYSLYLGDTAKARELMEAADQYKTCKYCKYCECPDYYMTMGYISEAEGDISSAVEYYNKALSLNPNSVSAVYRLRRLGQVK